MEPGRLFLAFTQFPYPLFPGCNSLGLHWRVGTLLILPNASINIAYIGCGVRVIASPDHYSLDLLKKTIDRRRKEAGLPPMDEIEATDVETKVCITSSVGVT